MKLFFMCHYPKKNSMAEMSAAAQEALINAAGIAACFIGHTEDDSEVTADENDLPQVV